MFKQGREQLFLLQFPGGGCQASGPSPSTAAFSSCVVPPPSATLPAPQVRPLGVFPPLHACSLVCSSWLSWLLSSVPVSNVACKNTHIGNTEYTWAYQLPEGQECTRHATNNVAWLAWDSAFAVAFCRRSSALCRWCRYRSTTNPCRVRASALLMARISRAKVLSLAQSHRQCTGRLGRAPGPLPCCGPAVARLRRRRRFSLLFARKLLHDLVRCVGGEAASDTVAQYLHEPRAPIRRVER